MNKENELKETGTCSICRAEYTHWGNNPEPVRPYEERCCDRCNWEIVIPARMGKPVGFLGTYESYCESQMDIAPLLKQLNQEQAKRKA